MQLTRLVLISVMLPVIVACQHTAYRNANEEIAAVQQHVRDSWAETNYANNEPAPAVVEKNEMYVNVKPKQVAQQPDWLDRMVNINERKLTMEYYINRLLRNTPAYVEFDDNPVRSIYRTMLQWATFDKFDNGINVRKKTKIHFSHHGTVKEGLDKIAAMTNTHYEVDGNRVLWSRFKVKNFELPFIPQSQMNIVGSIKTETVDSSADGDSYRERILNFFKSATGENQLANSMDKSEYFKLEDLIWGDIKSTIGGLMSNYGAYHVSESTALITVRDYPSHVLQIEKYLEGLQKQLAQQIRIDVEVIDITLKESYKSGIDWNFVRQFVASKYNAILSGGSGQLTVPTVAAGSSLTVQAADGIWNNSRIILDALNQQGHLSVVTQPTVISLNGQTSTINIGEDQGYLQSVSVSRVSSLTDSPVTYELKPGTVKTGFSLSLTPKTQGKNVYLQLKSTLSTLDKIEDVSSQVSLASVASSNNVAAKIQVPKVTLKEFDQRSIVKSGSTLILAGFKQLHNQTEKDQVLRSDALGGKAAYQANKQTIVLITPRILHVE